MKSCCVLNVFPFNCQDRAIAHLFAGDDTCADGYDDDNEDVDDDMVIELVFNVQYIV